MIISLFVIYVCFIVVVDLVDMKVLFRGYIDFNLIYIVISFFVVLELVIFVYDCISGVKVRRSFGEKC